MLPLETSKQLCSHSFYKKTTPRAQYFPPELNHIPFMSTLVFLTLFFSLGEFPRSEAGRSGDPGPLTGVGSDTQSGTACGWAAAGRRDVWTCNHSFSPLSAFSSSFPYFISLSLDVFSYEFILPE